MNTVIEYEGKTLSYSTVTNKRLKHLSIHIHPERGVVVKNPGYLAVKVHELVQQKAAWIFQKVCLNTQRHRIKPLFENEGKILYLGEPILLHVNQNPEQFYKEKTLPLVREMVEKWAFIMGVAVKSVTFRKTKRRWGSCSHAAELSFTLTLSQLPLDAIEYIVIHELSHILHPHHQKAFWNCVAEYMPTFKMQERIIKNYSPALS